MAAVTTEEVAETTEEEIMVEMNNYQKDVLKVLMVNALDVTNILG